MILNAVSQVAENNKRIAKNTAMLYIRMFFIMAVTLYTSRVVLNVLGVVDFGIYNVVGGVVAMMGLFNSAMSVATQRYLTFELGKGDQVRLKQVFSMCFTIFILLALLILFLAETAGLWFLNAKLVIPISRMSAANWLYQYSILTCIAALFVAPYNAAIIAHEKMDVYAYVGIIEVLLKLGVVFLLEYISFDRLPVYGFFLFLAQVVVTGLYAVYSIRYYAECRYRFYWEKSLFRELLSYSGWNIFGSLAALAKGQGLNILLNMFFTPTVNAARGIAYQINTAVTLFFTNFYTAVKPQVIKYYSQGELMDMFKLVFRSSKMSFYLILLISLPIIIETPFIIQLWLGQLPNYVVGFTRLIIVVSAIDALATPLMTVAHATGHIKLYQSLVGTMVIMNVPISYVFLKLGFSPYIVFYISIFISIACLFTRLWIVHRLMPFPVKDYVVKVFGNSLTVGLMASLLPVLLHSLLDTSLAAVVAVCLVSLVSSCLCVYYVGLERDERLFVLQIVRKKLLKRI